ncbi:MAG TPA: anti-sigma factor [Gemmataceae bacterium]
MNCTQIQNLIHAYFDRELDLVRQLEIEHHLPECPDCARVHESLQTLHAGLSAEALYYLAPAGLRERLRAARQSVAATLPRMRRAAPWRWIGFVAATAALVFLGWGLGQIVRLPSVSPYVPLSAADSRLAQDVVASHVRSLMAAHLVDVQSDNRHVVKPWFIGKVDVAPDVKDDLTVEGFPLVGGRLDYFDNRPVAAIVYRKDKHIINLFLSRSEPDAAETIQGGKLRGYELRHWSQSGLSCWVVSDLNATDLNEFVKRLRSP